MKNCCLCQKSFDGESIYCSGCIPTQVTPYRHTQTPWFQTPDVLRVATQTNKIIENKKTRKVYSITITADELVFSYMRRTFCEIHTNGTEYSCLICGNKRDYYYTNGLDLTNRIVVCSEKCLLKYAAESDSLVRCFLDGESTKAQRETIKKQFLTFGNFNFNPSRRE